MRKSINSWNKKVDNIDNWLNEVFGNKLPQYLEKNMKKIYLLFFFLTLLGIKEAYEQRGYFAIGGEIMIMLIPVILKFYLEMRKDNKRYYELLREMEESEEEER